MTAVLSAPVTTVRPTPAVVSAAIADRAPFIPALAPVVGADAQVPVAAGHRVGYANLDYAASAPALASVAAQVAGALGEYASVHRGAGHLSQVTTRRYEAARETVRGFVRGRVDDSVVFTRNTTDAINLAAHITPGDVVVLDIEHHANLLPWCAPKDGRNRARVVTARATIEDTLVAIEAELASEPASLLAVTAASNVTGEVLPISRLASIAHRHGARILVDAAQLVAHRPISIVSHGIDYLAFSGHKAYAPFGAGVLIGRSDWFDAADPYLAGGGATADVELGGEESSAGTTWHTGAARHEAGRRTCSAPCRSPRRAPRSPSWGRRPSASTNYGSANGSTPASPASTAYVPCRSSPIRRTASASPASPSTASPRGPWPNT